MQDVFPTEAEKRRPEVRKRSRTPLIVGAFVLCGSVIQFLLKALWKLSRKNVPLSLGIFMFAALFALVAYNASFRQRSMARPILFSTRGENRTESGYSLSGQRPKIPFVDKTISVQVLERQGGENAPVAERDEIAALIAASAPQKILRGIVAVPEAKPRAGSARKELAASARMAAGLPRVQRAQAAPHYQVESDVEDKERYESGQKKWSLPSKDQVLRVQKALARAGQPSLAATGVWDIKTRAAVRRFQQVHGLPRTSRIDKKTMQKLRDLGLW